MILYAIPFTCSLAVRLALAALDIPHELAWMRRHEHLLADGSSFDLRNPKRRVPALQLPDGELLTEIVPILSWLDADVPRSPAERRRAHEWLAFVATEIHRPALFLMFDPASPPEVVRDAEERLLPPALAFLEGELAQRPTLLGHASPSPADFYLYWALTLARFRRVPAARSPALSAWFDRLKALPVVQRVVAEEQAAMAR